MLCAVALFILITALGGCSGDSDDSPKSVLVFSKTNGWRHDSIEAGIEAIRKLGLENNFDVTTTEDSLAFTNESLKNYDAVIFLLTTLDVLGDQQQVAFKRYIQAGGGYVGIHSASDTEYSWPWYGKLVGAYFTGHPSDPNVREGSLHVVDKTHLSTNHLETGWSRADEWYDVRFVNPDINTLIEIDETSYKTSQENPASEPRPIAWYHDFEGGRSFYTALGHTIASYSEPEFLSHILGGIQYTMGSGDIDYSRATVQPDENLFTKTVLVDSLNEPMELEFLGDDKIAFIERHGTIRIHDLNTNETTIAGSFPVFSGNEEGLIGIVADPDYETNHWIYLAYSHQDSLSPRIQLSRFILDGDQLQMSSENVLLTIPVTRGDACCHVGGSLEFDADGNLFMTVGENTNPFASAGTAPIDESPGRAAWDAQRTAGNTNDLRGKILRITPTDDASYTIPDGNLFSGEEGTRSEIYVMGNRNPFRVSVDKHTGYIYWGEVGPDASEDVPMRGPKGHDEINQAREAGYYGWPYFIADNKPYYDFNFRTGVSGSEFDISNPVNDSPNNTGLRNLPTPKPAFIWYPYTASSEFPQVGEGGRTAMAGPVFYQDDYKDSAVRFPEYYDGKLFIYEWMRNWISVVTMTDDGHYWDMERFMPNTLDISRPMDMLFAPDGSMYLLEYGTKWNAQNEDARLSRIVYNGR